MGWAWRDRVKNREWGMRGCYRTFMVLSDFLIFIRGMDLS
jgi:hypothetical protein